MSIAYAELLSAVVGQLEIDATDAARYGFDDNLATAQTGILNTLPFKYLTNAVTTTIRSIDNGVTLYQWPSDLVRFIEMWADFENALAPASGIHGCKCTPYNHENSHVRNIASLATKRYPYIDLNIEGGYGLYPVKTAQTPPVSGEVRIRYVWQIPNPTAIQACLFEYNLRNLMIYRATELCALIDEFNVPLSEKMGKLYNEELSRFLPKQGKK